MKKSISTLIESSIAEKVFPGAVAYILKDEKVLYHEALGFRSLKPKRLPMQRDTVFDLASLTKPIVVATLCLQLAATGELSLNTPAHTYLPQFRESDKPSKAGMTLTPDVTLLHLLTHTSGLPAWLPVYLRVASRADVVEYLGTVPLESRPGQKVVYSCLGYILLGELLPNITSQPLDAVAHHRIFAPLNMGQTRFNPPPAWRARCAATEDSTSFERRMVNYQRYDWREGVIVGEVHDENAHFLGGVSGNAGLFSTTTDLGKFCKMLMAGGGKILRPESVAAMCHVYPAVGERRAIGWSVPEDDMLYHTGFTGTSIRICLRRKLAAILLTNRVHPDAHRQGIIAFRNRFHEIVFGMQSPLS